MKKKEKHIFSFKTEKLKNRLKGYSRTPGSFFRFGFQKLKKITKIDFCDLRGEFNIKVLH